MKEIPIVEEVEFNLSRIIEGLPEGKLKEIAEDTKKKYDYIQDTLFRINEKIDEIKERLKEVLGEIE